MIQLYANKYLKYCAYFILTTKTDHKKNRILFSIYTLSNTLANQKISVSYYADNAMKILLSMRSQLNLTLSSRITHLYLDDSVIICSFSRVQ